MLHTLVNTLFIKTLLSEKGDTNLEEQNDLPENVFFHNEA